MKMPAKHSQALEEAAIKCERAESLSAASYAASDAASDNELAQTAEAVVQVLVDMGAPGAQWLELAPLAA